MPEGNLRDCRSLTVVCVSAEGVLSIAELPF
jgi:hypothetical protein